LSWDDHEVAGAHLVILRDARDFPARIEEFLAWTTQVQNLLNPPAVVAWNVDRRYLSDLADQGVPTVPAEAYRPGARVRLPPAGHLFVGPTVGTGTRRFSDHSAAAAYIEERHQAGDSVLVQPGGSDPESVLIFLGGRPSHAFTAQDQGVPEGLRQGDADFELWDVGAAALAAGAARAGVEMGELLYARVHLVGARVLELQLVDPSLGWRRLDADARGRVQRVFALAVESALERLGLGPFSHRRP
jgi:hypothetical protein